MERRMMHFYLALDSLSYVLSDGRTLFPISPSNSTNNLLAWLGAMASAKLR
ncbi:hypothetical protein ACFSVK_14890 [Azorhizophilus paspali]|uniref:hypothetical protein n=1 Tax=Azorhizophilus paspali TaxID=69963 RepID=UPI00362578E3